MEWWGRWGREGIYISWWIYPGGSTAHRGGQGRARRIRAAVYIKREEPCSFILVIRTHRRLDYQPDLPVRLRDNIPLTAKDRSKYYMEGNLTPLGYNDWPFADGSAREMGGKL